MAAALDDAAELVSRGRRVFDDDRLMRRAAEAIITRLGEAARRVPVEYQQAHPEVPWRQVAAMRNRLTHEYDRIDYELVWETLAVSFPVLAQQLTS